MATAGQTFSLVAATYTPFHADGSLNLAVIDGYARVLAERGVSNAFVCGTTGEGLSLSLDERMQVAQRWQAVAGENLGVIVHVGHTALPDAQALAAHAQSIGAQATASIGPTFFHPANVDDLVEWCAQIAAVAPALPFYYYHFPAMNSPRLPMTAFLRHASERILTFAGIKFTDENLMEYHACLDASDGQYAMLFGRDEILLSALVVGARGAVGSTYNLISPIFRQVIAAFDAGDLHAARHAQAHARRVIEVIITYGGGVVGGKAAMKALGVDCGPMRLPLRSLTPERTYALQTELETLGLAPEAVNSSRYV